MNDRRTEEVFELAFEVSRILAEANTATEPLSQILRLLTVRLDYDVGAVWRADEAQVLLRCTDFYDPTKQFPMFEQVSMSRTFPPGSGLPGQVWETRMAISTVDVVVSPTFPRASVAELEGLHGGMAFPVYVGLRVLGVFEFFSTERRESPAEVLEVMTFIGSQIGTFLQRLHVEDLLTGAEAEFKVLAEANIDAIVTIDEHGIIRFINPAFEQMLGYSKEEVVGQNLKIIIPLSLRDRHEAAMKRYFQSGEKTLNWNGVELPALCKDGTEFRARIAFGEFRRAGQRLFSGYIRKV